jgi:hypothetical protein
MWDATDLGLFSLLKGTSPDVNSKPCLSLNEDKACVILALASTKYELIGWLRSIIRPCYKVYNFIIPCLLYI